MPFRPCVLTAALLILFPSVLFANYGNFLNAEYVRNYDADTITFNLPGLHPIIGKKISIRLNGLDTPEIRGECDAEKRLAKEAKHFVQTILKNASVITLLNMQRGKYFRIVANVNVDGYDLTRLVMDAGYAVEYYGGKKVKDWCN